MKKLVWAISAVIMLSSCWNQRPRLDVDTYDEVKLPEAEQDLLWDKTGRGLHASFGSVDTRYEKYKVPMEIVVKDKSFTAWRGETINVQAVLWSAYDTEQVEGVFQPFVSARKDTIGLDGVHTFFVRYVVADSYGKGCGPREREVDEARLVADPLDSLTAMDMEAKSVRPVWISIAIPREATPGVYKSSLKFYSRKNSPQELRFTLEVLDRQLPDATEGDFHVNLKQDPLSIALWHEVKPWSDEHFKVMKPYMELLASSGQKSISCIMYEQLEDNGHFNTPTGMVEWVMDRKGQWRFDFTVLDKWVRYMSDMGVSRHINLYSILPENKHVFYRDERSNTMKMLSLEADNEARRAALKAYFTTLQRFLSDRAWMEKTSIVIEDRNQEHLSDFIYWMHRFEPDFRLTLITKRYRPEVLSKVQHLGLSASYITAESMIELKNARDLKASLAIECDMERPGLFSFSRPAEATWMGWFAAAHQLDGLYYAGFNNWPVQPLLDSRMKNAPSGHGFLVYPGCRSSIRFERLKEGIQDYYKINSLASHMDDADRSELSRILDKFNIHRMEVGEAAIMVNSGKAMLDSLAQIDKR